MTNLIILILLMIVVAVIGHALTNKRKNPEQLADASCANYRCRDSILTRGERAAFPALEAAVNLINRSSRGPQARLLCKVRVADLVYVAGGGSGGRSEYNRINQKHTDFVLVGSEDLCPLVVVELDDSSHQRPDRARRDRFIDSVMASAGIGIVHLPVAASYDAAKIAELLVRALPIHGSPAAAPAAFTVGGDVRHAARPR